VRLRRPFRAGCEITKSSHLDGVLKDAPLLTPSTVRRDRGRLVGRDPRGLTARDYAAADLAVMPPMKAIRAFCLECAGASPAEVRKCAAVRCPLWPLRMGRWPGRLTRRRV
jgi:hypothetical protein